MYKANPLKHRHHHLIIISIIQKTMKHQQPHEHQQRIPSTEISHVYV